MEPGVDTARLADAKRTTAVHAASDEPRLAGDEASGPRNLHHDVADRIQADVVVAQLARRAGRAAVRQPATRIARRH